MKIYTKTGDSGQTGIIGGRISKQSAIIETIGTFDELNACLGLVIVEDNLGLGDKLLLVQNIIFNIGSVLSGAKNEFDYVKATKKLEKQIDSLSSELPELTQFILPGGSKLSAQIHLCRTVCRRAERQLIRFKDEFIIEKPENTLIDIVCVDSIQKYINRLSDYLFVLARFANKQNQVDDVFWDKSVD